MAIKLENISNGKAIGIGNVTVLPGETKEVPVAFEHNPILEVYKNLGMARVSGKATTTQPTAEEIAAERATKDAEQKIAAEELRKARIASLDGITEEELGKLANELGINLADCKDQADVLKKVKTALKK